MRAVYMCSAQPLNSHTAAESVLRFAQLCDIITLPSDEKSGKHRKVNRW